MAQGYRAQPKDGAEDIAAQLKELQRRVAQLEGGAPNRNAAISDGGDLTVLDTNGNQVVKLGHDSAGARGLSLTTDELVDMLDFGISTVTPGRPVLNLNDSTGALAFGTDPAVDGTGIFWPLVPLVMAPMTIALWPFNTTGSFVTVAQLYSYRASQGATIIARVICYGGATAGQARLLVDGVQVDATATVGTSAADATFSGLPGGTIRSPAFIELQTRVTAGAGNCAIQAYGAMWHPNAYVI